MMCLIISAPSFPQTLTVTEAEVREWARQIQECKADQRAFKFAAVENMALADSLSKLRFEYKITAAELATAEKKIKNRFWTILILSLILIGITYLLIRQKK